jgi:hypothetical protein
MSDSQPVSQHVQRREQRLPRLVVRQVSVAVDFDQALVADPEVVGDFMEHNPPHL